MVTGLKVAITASSVAGFSKSVNIPILSCAISLTNSQTIASPSQCLETHKTSPKRLTFLNRSFSLSVLSIFLSIKMHSFSYPIVAGFICATNLCITPFETDLLILSFAALGVIPTAEAMFL